MEFANAEEFKATLVEMMTSRGHLQVDARTNALIISDIPNRVELIAQMAKQLDSRTPQVEIVSKIVDIANQDSRNLGIEWSAANLMAGQVIGGAGVSASTAGAAGGMRVGTVQSWGQLDLMIDALASKKKANVISNPTITTVNNREAKILVGSKIPLIVADEAGNAITQLTTIGIQMRVTPHVNSDNTISLDLHPEISELSSQATVQGGVIINTSEADTRVIVQDGETAIIGGLIRDNQSETKTGIPVLQDIPLVGWLFRNSNISDDKREMIIFVTPRLINGDLTQG
jgi:type II secretory pathway component GspD/PulD (secretin)